MLGGLYGQPQESRYNVRGTLGWGGVSYLTLSQTPSVISRSVTTGPHFLVLKGQGYTIKIIVFFLWQFLTFSAALGARAFLIQVS